MDSGRFKVVITDSYYPTLDAEREEFRDLSVDLVLAQSKDSCKIIE